MGQEADVQAAFRLCQDTYFPVDVLINNAGLGLPTPTWPKLTSKPAGTR